jgi:hypothetical protein
LALRVTVHDPELQQGGGGGGDCRVRNCSTVTRGLRFSAFGCFLRVLAEGVNGSHNRVRCCRKEKSHAKYTECAFL